MSNASAEREQQEQQKQDVSGFFRGNILVLALSGAIGSLGGFTFQTLGPTVPFYIFAAAELVAMLLLIVMVKEPETKRRLNNYPLEEHC